jgi:Fe/S biogenesis protein NfuA
MGGQLIFKASNSKTTYVDESSSLEDRINYILYDEINSSLAAHVGEVSLVEVTDRKLAILKFSGDSQSCFSVDVSLMYGVEIALLECIPELTSMRDQTDRLSAHM